MSDGPHPHRPFHTDEELDPIARLEWLDDLMFAAIDGDPVALDYAADAWNKTRDELGEPASRKPGSSTSDTPKPCGTHSACSRIIRRIKFSRRLRSSRCWR